VRVTGVLFALVVAFALPAAARAEVRVVGAAQGYLTASPALNFSFAGLPKDPDQLWAISLSLPSDSVTVDAITYRGRNFTRAVASAGFGTRTEVWTLAAPDVSTGSQRIDITFSAPTTTRLAFLQLAGVHRTTPLGDFAFGAANEPIFATTLWLGNWPGQADAVIGVLTAANGANVSNLTTTPNGTGWGSTSGPDGTMMVRGTVRPGADRPSQLWMWAAADPLAANPYTAVLLTIRAPDRAPVTAAPASAVTKTSATLGGNVTGDGGGTVTARGVVYCTCPTPAIGGTGVIRLNAADGGTGAFSVSASNLAEGTQYTVRAFAINGGGTSYSDPITFTTVANAPPANVTITPANRTISEGDSLTLAAAATDVDGDGLTYTWDVNGDGTYGDAAGGAPLLTWAQLAALGLDGPATSSVRVRVSDGKNPAVTSAPATLSITNLAPTATISNPGRVPEGGTADIDISSPADPSPADLATGIRYGYDFDGDGTWEIGSATYATASTQRKVAVPASYLADGPVTRTVRVAIIDRDDGRRVVSFPIDVLNVAPSLDVQPPNPAVEGESGQVSVSDVIDPSAVDLAAGVRFQYDLDGDGTFEVGGTTYATAVSNATQTVPAALNADGPSQRTIHVAAIDRDEGRHVYDATFTVTNAAPTATLADATTASGTPARLEFTDADDASAADKAAGFTYEWDVDGTFTPGEAAVDVPAPPGPATLTVKGAILDRDGGRREYTATVTVKAPDPAPLPEPTVVPQAAPTVVPQPAPKQTLSGLAITPRCIRARSVRAVIARTVAVRFSLALPGPVSVKLERWKDKAGQAKCPPPQGYAPAGKRPRGTYSPFTAKTLAGKAGRNTVTLATTGKGGKRLRPGTYLLTISAGGATARAKVWVLD
jgi:hypothetical protein